MPVDASTAVRSPLVLWVETDASEGTERKHHVSLTKHPATALSVEDITADPTYKLLDSTYNLNSTDEILRVAGRQKGIKEGDTISRLTLSTGSKIRSVDVLHVAGSLLIKSLDTSVSADDSVLERNIIPC